METDLPASTLRIGHRWILWLQITESNGCHHDSSEIIALYEGPVVGIIEKES